MQENILYIFICYKYIKDLQSLNQDQIEKKQDSINVHKKEIKETFEESKKLGKNLSTLLKEEDKRYKTNNDEISNLKSHDLQYTQKIKDLVGQARFYEDNDHCPTCDQDIGQGLKDKKISEIKKGSPTITNDKAAVMAGLNIASMYLAKDDQVQDLESVSDELETIQNTLKFDGDT